MPVEFREQGREIDRLIAGDDDDGALAEGRHLLQVRPARDGNDPFPGSLVEDIRIQGDLPGAIHDDADGVLVLPGRPPPGPEFWRFDGE
ncbi:hypothetical protein DSECCO2_425720 [anaerobic digester metagenome]